MASWQDSVGEWHWGQLLVALVALAAVAFIGLGIGAVMIEADTYTLETVGTLLVLASLGAPFVIALVVLWTWFGARREL